MPRFIQSARNSGKAENTDSDESCDTGVGSGAKRARKQGSGMKNNEGNNNSSSNSHNNASINSSDGNYAFREVKNILSVGKATENRVARGLALGVSLM